nr:hypothetical protein CFP56_38912 [Quercus suber]
MMPYSPQGSGRLVHTQDRNGLSVDLIEIMLYLCTLEPTAYVESPDLSCYSPARLCHKVAPERIFLAYLCFSSLCRNVVFGEDTASKQYAVAASKSLICYTCGL